MKYLHNNLLPLAIVLLASCSNYLDVKPDKKLTIPNTTSDLMALMQDVQTMNYDYSVGLGEIGSDDIFLPYSNWASIASIENRSVYIWEKHPVYANYWTNGYERILNSNTVVDFLDDVIQDRDVDRNWLLGTALFFRGYAFYDLAQVFSPAFNSETADSDTGIVLRLNSDVNVPSKRASVRQTYDQVIRDLQSSAALLPEMRQQYPTQPTKAAAYGALARCFLAMQQYVEAGKYADSCLRLHNELLDFNEIEQKPYAFNRFNQEVVFFSQLTGYGILTESRARVDTNLYASYSEYDLRKGLFFRMNNDGYASFSGNYAESTNVPKFNGITSAEMMLTRAEASAREGDVESALRDLNDFMRYRYEASWFEEVTESDMDRLLDMILLERRKELVCRGIRWQDIRRMSGDKNRVITLQRTLDGTIYTLTPTQLSRFAYQLPQVVIDRSDLEQNK
ncbi:MAG: RagB/SusD family nutrient uptake outer membrane protein [Parapedobacter sp.]|nr:MAG: RagB/SusD family nutrient uptake outer membrane protein [Parapedobacter sp.]